MLTHLPQAELVARDRPQPGLHDRPVPTGNPALPQVKAARVTADYDTQYGANTGPWTTEMFVEAVYHSLTGGR